MLTRPARLGPLLACAAVFAMAGAAAGHDLGFTRTSLALFDGGSFRLDMRVDLDALALGMPSSTDDAELMRMLESMPAQEIEKAVDDLRQTFLRRVRIRFDGEVYLPDVGFPERGSEQARESRTVLGLTARLTGELPAGAREVSVQASRAFPPLHISIIDLRGRVISAARLDELAAADTLADTLGDRVTARQALERGERSDPYPLDHPPAPPGRLEVARQYAALGFEHIVPLGLDHILFVLGLYLLNTAWRPLLAQVTAFTAAHTLTLALSTYGVLRLPSTVVEPLIALSIAWIAFENVATSELKPWRSAIVFGFGLLHGLGFAGVLTELGLPRGEYITALLSFNLGVELGQVSVIAAALATFGWFRQRSWYRARVTVPLSVLIGFIGLYWVLERVA